MMLRTRTGHRHVSHVSLGHWMIGNGLPSVYECIKASLGFSTIPLTGLPHSIHEGNF